MSRSVRFADKVYGFPSFSAKTANDWIFALAHQTESTSCISFCSFSTCTILKTRSLTKRKTSEIRILTASSKWLLGFFSNLFTIFELLLWNIRQHSHTYLHTSVTYFVQCNWENRKDLTFATFVPNSAFSAQNRSQFSRFTPAKARGRVLSFFPTSFHSLSSEEHKHNSWFYAPSPSKCAVYAIELKHTPSHTHTHTHTKIPQQQRHQSPLLLSPHPAVAHITHPPVTHTVFPHSAHSPPPSSRRPRAAAPGFATRSPPASPDPRRHWSSGATSRLVASASAFRAKHCQVTPLGQQTTSQHVAQCFEEREELRIFIRCEELSAASGLSVCTRHTLLPSPMMDDKISKVRSMVNANTISSLRYGSRAEICVWTQKCRNKCLAACAHYRHGGTHTQESYSQTQRSQLPVAILFVFHSVHKSFCGVKSISINKTFPMPLPAQTIGKRRSPKKVDNNNDQAQDRKHKHHRKHHVKYQNFTDIKFPRTKLKRQRLSTAYFRTTREKTRFYEQQKT